ncbi:hypothetical protein AMTRI_Chr09g37900 [Amborella trichopoda]
MRLEDFFTLTEMKDGLSSLSRVEELVSVMQQEKDSAVNNFSDAPRQWSSVASIIAATESHNCLNHFLRLGGLKFLDQWLQETHRHSNDENDGSIEESVSALLGALGKLPIDSETSATSGIGITVECLRGHKSSVIKQRAFKLLDSWKRARDLDKVENHVAMDGNSCQDEKHNKLVTKTGANLSKISTDGGESSTLESAKQESTGPKIEKIDCELASVVSHSGVISEGAAALPGLDKSGKVPDVANVGDPCLPGSAAIVDRGCRSFQSIEEACLVKGWTSAAGSGQQSESNVHEKTSNQAESGGYASAGSGHLLKLRENIVHEKSPKKVESGGTNSTSSGNPLNPKENIFHERSPKKAESAEINSTGSGLPLKITEDTVHEKTSGKAESGGTNSAGSGLPLKPRENNAHEKTPSKEESSDLDGILKDAMEVKKEGTPCKDVLALGSNNKENFGGSLSTRERSHTEVDLSCNTDTIEMDSSAKEVMAASLGTQIVRKENNGSGSSLSQMEMTENVRPGDRATESKGAQEKPGSLGKTSQGSEVFGSTKILRGPSRESNPRSNKRPKKLKPDIIQKELEEDKTRTGVSEMELDYGVDDALEVARKVAKEVEREVVTYRELPYSSSSEKNEIGETMHQTSSADSKQQKQVDPSFDATESSSAMLDGSSSPKLEASDAKPKDHDSSQSPTDTLPNQEAADKIEEQKCVFDLNEVIHTEENEWLTISTVSVPIAVVPPKGLPSLASVPLQFEGERGWKGTAATSAFRPASPRKNLESEKMASTNDVKQLKFDLNVVDADEEIGVYVGAHVPASSSFRSPASSSVEVSSRRTEALKLDLNSVDENDGSCPQSPISSSVRQRAMRDIDLNDNPYFVDLSSNGGPVGKLDDPVVSIMGSVISGGGRVGSPPMALPFPPPPPPALQFGFNGLTMGPAISIPSGLYPPGHVPYMVDSRGAAVIPQVIGSSMSRSPPFFMSVGGGIATNGIGFVRPPNLDLNVRGGMASGGEVEGQREGEGGGLRQLFGQGQQVDEQFKSFQPATTSGASLKRKEPDCGGWESYTVGYKQATSWH